MRLAGYQLTAQGSAKPTQKVSRRSPRQFIFSFFYDVSITLDELCFLFLINKKQDVGGSIQIWEGQKAWAGVLSGQADAESVAGRRFDEAMWSVKTLFSRKI